MDEISELRAAIGRLQADIELRDMILTQVVCKAAASDGKRGGYIDDIEGQSEVVIRSLDRPGNVIAYMLDRSARLHRIFRNTFAKPENLPKTGTANEP